MNRIFVLTGSTAAGKDTILKYLIPQLDPAKYERLVRYTTRPERVDGSDKDLYKFITQKQMIEGLYKKQWLEYEEYDTPGGKIYYATAITDINISMSNYITSAAINVVQDLTKYFDEDHVVPIYIMCPAKTRLKRALGRIDTENDNDIYEICRRFYTDSEKYKDFNLTACKTFYNKGPILNVVSDIKDYILSFE